VSSPDASSAPEAVLQEELAFFATHRDQLLKDHPGKFALIKGSHLIGTFDTDENAYAAGVAQFGREPFLIRHIVATDPLAQFPALTFGLLRVDS
jgi:hypothetical protein